MNRLLLPVVVSLSLGLAACNLGSQQGTNSSDASSSASSEASDTLVTHNVSYTGVIEELGVTSSMQGTHKLMTRDGELVLLQSSDVTLDLDTYLGQRVEVRGSLQAAVEAGAMMLNVEEVIMLEGSSSSASSSEATVDGTKKMCGGIAGIQCEKDQECVDDPADSCDPLQGGADCSGICITKMMESSSSVSSAPSSVAKTSSSSSSSQPKVTTSSSTVSSSQSSAPAPSAAMEQQNALLAKQTYDQDSLWTQKYCTTHIAFCVPVHKNWYFTSFGATTSNLWHVELGMNEITNLGDGAIVINLVSGTSASMQAQDGQIKTQGADVIGFKDWEDGTHFEIIADARLKAAVSYMISHITPYAGVQ